LLKLQGNYHAVSAWCHSTPAVLHGRRPRAVDLSNPDTVAPAFLEARPDVVVHTAALARVGDCFQNPDRARLVNTEGTVLLARLAAECGARLVYVSTDLVFDGQRGGYQETDPTNPLSVYGRTKRDAEATVLACPRHVVVRISLLFGPSLGGKPTTFDEQVAALLSGRTLTLFEDEWRTPLSAQVAADSLVSVALSDFSGLLHLGGPERLSRLEMGQRLAVHLGVAPSLVVANKRGDVATAEPRPRDTSLDSQLWRSLFANQAWPGFDDALSELLAD
jgi:dTDP-4-dehydrorhamnose reductase